MDKLRDEKGRFIKQSEPENQTQQSEQKSAKPEKVDTRPVFAGQIEPSYKKRQKLGDGIYLFTCAQNNTPIHAGFWLALLNFAKRHNAQIFIGQSVYNKNGFQNGVHDSDSLWYAPELADYFLTEQVKIGSNLVWCGELNILPTAKRPLSGFEQYTGPNSAILPTSRIALESVAVPKGQDAKMLFGTGYVTQRNYIQKKVGQQAEAAHCYGALLVQVIDGIFHARQIQATEEGSFQDLHTVYHPDGSVTTGNIVALNLGDLHCEKMCPDSLAAACYLIEKYRPENVVLHDTFDMMARNHHNRKNPHFLAKTHYDGLTVEQDLKTTVEVLDKLAKAGSNSVFHVVESNHDLALEKWLADPGYDFRSDPANALVYLQLQEHVYFCLLYGLEMAILDYALGVMGEGTNGLFSEYCEQFNFLKTDQSLQIVGIEFCYHGHSGLNGSKGSPKQFEKLNLPMNTGHTHSASIFGQVYTAGVTGSLDMGYNTGPSSWSHSHILTYENGMRTIVTFKRDKDGNLTAGL